MTQATKKKHVSREVIDNFEFPNDNEEIVQIIRGCGNNLHEIRTPDGDKYLVSMPTKFRRSIWIKRGDYCVVTPIAEGNKVRGEIVSILLKEQIRYFKTHNRWPKQFEDVDGDEDAIASRINNQDEDDEEEDEEDEDDDLVPNTNRVYFDESSSSSSSSYDEDGEEDAESEEEEDNFSHDNNAAINATKIDTQTIATNNRQEKDILSFQK